MSNIIIFDFEVFKFDCLFGGLIIKEDGSEQVYQTWNIQDMLAFYDLHIHDLWVGHNNDGYDNHIIKGIKDNVDPYYKSKSIINNAFRGKADLEILSYDLMCCRFYSLKMTELLTGKSIHTSEVDFNLQRPLTKEEKLLTEDYNKDDLYQSRDNFYELKDQMMLRLALINEFNIDKKYLTATEARLAALALGAKQIPGIEYQYVKPTIYSTLQLKNQAVIDFYLNEGFRHGENIDIVLSGIVHKMGAGGLHGAVPCCHETNMIYLDVSGYYNLVMINYDLLPRTIPESGKALYEKMYHDQLALKGVNDTKRYVYKTILLAVFGASMNKHTDFFDPQIGSLITITGQLFIIDLLEKLEGKIKLIQTNTDGIIVKPLPGHTEEEILDIVKEWCSRTGFVIKPKHIDELHQRDVNCYCYKTGDNWEVRGDAFVGSWGMDAPVKAELYTSKEPPIVSLAVKDYLLNKIKPEDTINAHKDDLRYYQYLCKKLSYDYCKYETTNLETKEVSSIDVADINRAFALKFDGVHMNVIVKYKNSYGKESHSKIANMPDNYFIYNGEILSEKANKELREKIDFQFYIDRAYKRIMEFVDVPMIKDINCYE